MEDEMLKNGRRGKSREGDLSRWDRYKKVFLGGTAFLAILAGVVTHTRDIYSAFVSFFPASTSPELQLGWLTIKDPIVFDTCELSRRGTFKLSNGTLVAIADNACYQALNKRLDAQKASDAIQTIGQSVFLLVENDGGPIESLTFLSSSPVAKIASKPLRPVKGTAIAYCVSFQGKGGVAGYSDPVVSAVVKRANTNPLEVSVPPSDGTIASGVTDCSASMVYSYPEI